MSDTFDHEGDAFDSYEAYRNWELDYWYGAVYGYDMAIRRIPALAPTNTPEGFEDVD